MLFLTFGNFLMLSIQFVSQTIRRHRYWSIMQRLLRNASILVQHNRSVQSSTSLLNLAELSNNSEFEDDYIQISSVKPVQEVDLSSWTAYTSYLETHNSVAAPNQNICILMEARRPRHLDKFVSDSLRIPPMWRVHVLSLGCPIAWKTAEPFGIILHCSFSGLVSLTDAFGQDRLTLDEDLELTRFATVKTIGSPQMLMQQSEEILPIQQAESFSRTHESFTKDGSFKLNTFSAQTDLNSQGRQSHKQTDFSSERIQSYSAQTDFQERQYYSVQTNFNSQVNQSAISYTGEKISSSLDKHQQLSDQPSISSNNNCEVDHTEVFVVHQPAKITAKTFRNKTASVALPNNSYLKNESSLDKARSGHDGSRMKPPNILVYCGLKDSSRIFAQVQSSLEACINNEAYTIYHLKHESILSTPWRINTALLVVSSCINLRPDVKAEFENFVIKDSGILVSFNSSVDSAFAEKLEDGIDGEQLVSFKFKGSQSITSARGRFFYSGLKKNSEIIVPYELREPQNNDRNDALNQISKSPKENSVPGDISHLEARALVVKITCEGGGVTVLSQLLLEKDPTEYAKDEVSFAALKQSNTDRLAVLRDILTSLGIDTSSGTIPELTSCILLAQRVGLKESFLESFKYRLKDNNLLKSQKMSLKFVQSLDTTAATPTLLPVITDIDLDAKAEYFNPATYWRNLRTLKLGQVLFYTDVITSTMTVFDGLQFSIPDGVGPIAVAGRQTNGKGRGGNSWLSPAGCAMFTLPLSMSLDSELGHRVSFLQHMISVAVVESVLTLPGYENLDIKVKWPNDIYYGKEMKLGGVLVTSTVMDSIIYATIGCGFNVSNSNPTICINDIIRLRNISNPNLPELSPLNSSQLIARTVTCLENLLQKFEKDGYQAFCNQYYKYWLHGNSKVHLQLDTNTEGVIVGLDDFGFLSVSTPDGVISVQPDGNSFDMLHNLIHVKPHTT